MRKRASHQGGQRYSAIRIEHIDVGGERPRRRFRLRSHASRKSASRGGGCEPERRRRDAVSGRSAPESAAPSSSSAATSSRSDDGGDACDDDADDDGCRHGPTLRHCTGRRGCRDGDGGRPLLQIAHPEPWAGALAGTQTGHTRDAHPRLKNALETSRDSKPGKSSATFRYRRVGLVNGGFACCTTLALPHKHTLPTSRRTYQDKIKGQFSKEFLTNSSSVFQEELILPLFLHTSVLQNHVNEMGNT